MIEEYTKTTMEVEAWLNTMPHDVVCVLTARSILRSLPIEFVRHIKYYEKTYDWSLRTHGRVDELGATILPMFRSIAVTLYAGVWGDRMIDFLKTGSILKIAGFSLAAIPIEYVHHERAGRAAAATIAYKSLSDFGLVGSLKRYSHIEKKRRYLEGRDISASEDATFIEADGSAVELTKRPLWTDADDFLKHPVGEDWLNLKERLHVLDQHWEVWTTWYESLLHGTWYTSKSEQTEVGLSPTNGDYGRVTLPSLYGEDPLKANREIKAILQRKGR